MIGQTVLVKNKRYPQIVMDKIRVGSISNNNKTAYLCQCSENKHISVVDPYNIEKIIKTERVIPEFGE